MEFLHSRQAAKCVVGAVEWVCERIELMKTSEYKALSYRAGSTQYKLACEQVALHSLDPTDQMRIDQT